MELLERASPKKVSAAPPFLRRGRKRCAAPGIICTANRALNREVKRDVRILAMNQTGVDKLQTSDPGEA
jgi:hypothetical protein